VKYLPLRRLLSVTNRYRGWGKWGHSEAYARLVGSTHSASWLTVVS
jgi:hypothetical protein